jgi:hypothetical protein
MSTTRPDGSQQLSTAILTSSDIDALAKANVAPGEILPMLRAKMPELSGAIDVFMRSSRHSDGEIWKFIRGLIAGRERERRRAIKAAETAERRRARDRIRKQDAAIARKEASGQRRIPEPEPTETAESVELVESVESAEIAENPALSTSSSTSKIDDDKEDGDRRARATDLNVPAEQTATEIEHIVKSAGKWPLGGWGHNVLVSQVERRIKLCNNPRIMLDAVRIATARATGVIHSFAYFDAEIARAQARATEEPPLPFRGSLKAIQGGQQRANREYRNIQEEADNAAADLVEQVKRQSTFNGGG